MSSFLNAMRRLFERDSDRHSKRARQEADDSAASNAAAGGERGIDVQRQLSAPLLCASRSAVALPPDFLSRVRRLVAAGWDTFRAAEALERNQFDEAAAQRWLEQQGAPRRQMLSHPHPQRAAASAGAAAVAASSSSAAPAEAAQSQMQAELAAIPQCKFERLPPLPPPSPSSNSSLSPPLAAAGAGHAAPSLQLESLLSFSGPNWSCGRCTFDNVPSALRCEMCDSARVFTAAEEARRGQLASCDICLEDELPALLAFDEPAAAACGHRVCKQCMRAYLHSKVDAGGADPVSLQTLRCPGFRCDRTLDDTFVRRALSCDRQWARLLRFRRLGQLAADPNVLLCPTPGCEVALFHEAPSAASAAAPAAGSGLALRCPDCSQVQCFHCRVAWHAGLTCAEFQSTQALQSEEAKIAQLGANERRFHRFLEENANKYRQCRGCGVWVEKVEGCDKMRCRCNYRFCFSCGVENATCHCTGSNHGFFDHDTVLRNWQPPPGAPGTLSRLALMRDVADGRHRSDIGAIMRFRTRSEAQNAAAAQTRHEAWL